MAMVRVMVANLTHRHQTSNRLSLLPYTYYPHLSREFAASGNTRLQAEYPAISTIAINWRWLPGYLGLMISHRDLENNVSLDGSTWK
jgi:hypothetical protein